MTGPTRKRSGCSPWALMGCGCGLGAMIGIALIFLALGYVRVRERANPRWNTAAYAACQQHLRSINRALASYRQDYGTLPPNLAALEAHYLHAPSQLRCPLDGTPYRYSPTPSAPTAPLVSCHHHREGPVILLHNGRLRLSDNALSGRAGTTAPR